MKYFSTEIGDAIDGWMEKTGGYARDMSLRDYFAAKAMQTLLGSEYTSAHGLCEGWMSAMVRESYMVADAMLKEGK